MRSDQHPVGATGSFHPQRELTWPFHQMGRFSCSAAEQAAGAGDYASAREYLRQAIGLQEARLGPTHPVLANILNNLGAIYEREGKPAEAEDCYRRR